MDSLDVGTYTLRAWVMRVGTSEPNAWKYSEPITVHFVKVASVSESATEVCVNQEVTFTANPALALHCVEWEWRYREDDDANWTDWAWVEHGDTAELDSNTSNTPGEYQYRAFNGDSNTCATDVNSEIVTVVEVGDVNFSCASVCVGGTCTASADTLPSGRDITWSILEPDLGCSIDPNSGVITAGTTAGTITVKGADANVPSCSETNQLDVVDVGTIEIKYDATNWDDVTDANIVVLKGTRYLFRVWPDPEGASWPNPPQWSGAASGVGIFKWVTFNTKGAQEVMVKCCCATGKKVTIKVVLPEPNDVSFVDDAGDPHNEEHDIYGISDPVWKRGGGAGEPVSYTKKSKVEVKARFWASDDLTYSTGVDVDVSGTGWGGFTEDQNVTFHTWVSDMSHHITWWNLTDNIGSDNPSFAWEYKVDAPVGTGNWVPMDSNSGPHKIYRVYGPPKCGDPNYTKSNISEAVGRADGKTTESEIASKANDTVSGTLYDGCICDDGFQKNFDAAMYRFPSDPNKGMCCCRAEGLNCVLQVLGIGPYTHDYVNEVNEPNPNKEVYVSHCSICDKDVTRCYWDGFWNHWEGVVKAGDTGSMCYAPGQGSLTIDEGTYDDFDSAIASDCGYYWKWGKKKTDVCPHLGPP